MGSCRSRAVSGASTSLRKSLKRDGGGNHSAGAYIKNDMSTTAPPINRDCDADFPAEDSRSRIGPPPSWRPVVTLGTVLGRPHYSLLPRDVWATRTSRSV